MTAGMTGNTGCAFEHLRRLAESPRHANKCCHSFVAAAAAKLAGRPLSNAHTRWPSARPALALIGLYRIGFALDWIVSAALRPDS